MTPRPYQANAIAAVESHWGDGIRSVCLVAPTGAGKTFLGQSLTGRRTALWVAHRRELVLNAADRLRQAFGRDAVGIIMPGEFATPGARIQVGTVQTLLARKALPAAERLVLDEAHHYMAEDWRELRRAYGESLTLGLTATPERQDGEALGDIFEKLVVAAHYSELVTDGFLVPARVLQPPKQLGNDLAQDPIQAWLKHSEGTQTFVFMLRVAAAEELAKRFRDIGVRAQVIEANTPRRERDDTLESFRRGHTRVLCNVNTLTEGVDVPQARCALLARGFGHVGGYLQCVGRVLRPADGKPDAIVIDLCGATRRFGMPTDDRRYSLKGRPISGGEAPEGGGGGDVTQKVLSLELQMAAPGAWKPGVAAQAEARPVDEEARRAEFVRLRDLARKHRMRDGFAAAKYREKYGEEPSGDWA